MKPTYTVIIYTPQELNHSSYIQTGLFELEQQDVVTVQVQLDSSKKLGKTTITNTGELIETNQTQPKTSFYKLINNVTKESVFFATDLYDFANVFSTYALEKCDVVFKRSFERRYIDSLPENQQEKIQKLGLSFGVHSNFKKDDFLFKLGLFISNLLVQLKADRLLFKRLFKSYQAQKKHWTFIKTTRKIDRFQNHQSTKKNTILFQTRCFLREDHEDVIAIHKQRYKIIKLLRNNFPNQFTGGFIPSLIVNQKYSDALSNVPSDLVLYLDAVKNAKIVIYTRGLANSPAWKMAEYLSQGKVIIAEPLTTELPVPLEHGKEVLFFNSNEELIKNIQLVLTDVTLADQLSENARNYYVKHVDPTQNVKRMLDFMTAKFKNQL